MRYQNLFEALQNVCGFTAIESDMFEIIEAYKKDVDSKKLNTIYFFAQIKNPSDNVTYSFLCPFKEYDIFFEKIGGSNEEINYNHLDETLMVTMPIFSENPKFINIYLKNNFVIDNE